MNNNIIKLEDFNNKSLDDIIDLYTYGYRLENQPSQLSQPPIQKLQTMPSLSLLVGGVLLAGIAAGVTLMLLLKMQKNK